MADQKTFMVEDAQLIFRNFSGKEGQYNREGDKNFAVILDPDVAEQMLADGWNVRYLKPREEGDSPTPYIQVTVNYTQRPPRVVLIADDVRTNLTDDSVGTLDWAEIQTCDLIANGYEWEVNGKRGIKAYLKSLYVTIEQDDLERKYGPASE